MRSSADFSRVLSTGERRGNKYVTVAIDRRRDDRADLPRVGFVVSKRVGNSVVRHRVVRILRHVMIPRLSQLECWGVVILARPDAARASFHDLEKAVDRAFSALGVPSDEEMVGTSALRDSHKASKDSNGDAKVREQ